MLKAKDVTVLIVDNVPDSIGDTFDPDGIEFGDPIPVTKDTERPQIGVNIIGQAVLSLKGVTLLADITFLDGLPGVRALIPTLPYLTPSVCGVSLKSQKEGDFNRIKRCKIDYIALSITGNSDRRIKTISEQKIDILTLS